jgi:sRNA-binding protein
MSKFGRAIPILVELTGKPLFIRMRDEGVAIPMAIGIHAVLETETTDLETAKAIREAIVALARSKRYRRAMMLHGAMRHDADGNPVEPVSKAHQAYAKEVDDRVRELALAREKAAQPPRPVLTLKST